MTEQTDHRPSNPTDPTGSSDASEETAPAERPAPIRPARYRKGTPLHWEPTPPDEH